MEKMTRMKIKLQVLLNKNRIRRKSLKLKNNSNTYNSQCSKDKFRSKTNKKMMMKMMKNQMRPKNLL